MQVRLLVLPNLEPYLRLLEPEMILEKQKNEIKRHEAWRVYGALLSAAGQCVYDSLKIFPTWPSPPARTWGGISGKIVIEGSNKRKAELEFSEQSPSKKIATDGPIDMVPSDNTPFRGQGDATAPPPSSDSDVGPSSSEQIPTDSKSGSRMGRHKVDQRVIKRSAILNQVWKEDLKSGHTLVTLFELFGEGILSFIPAPEMALFL
ncbi:hypothetical protein Tsubulata_050942 [Turnera subulata]|uniref:Uncharacterized protein n=1 Tax=Turnera subulata TaxID=218843 RepID=A0A9Q0GHN5_9ROSI|nr:hypothetical protein Tsubulata_050942 [Turnera subulata]